MADQSEPRIRMNIENRLKEDRTGSLRSSISAGFAEQVLAIEAALKIGVSPDEYRRLSTLKKGLEAAALVLKRTWSYYHP